MGWYQVTKRINGRFYLYWQKTYRLNGRVKTLNQYVGPVAAKTPPRRSLAAQMGNLPEAHKKLRAEFDAGKITKVEYLAYHEALGTEEPQASIRRALPDEPNNALWKLNPYYNPEGVDLRQYNKAMAQERRDDERIQYEKL